MYKYVNTEYLELQKKYEKQYHTSSKESRTDEHGKVWNESIGNAVCKKNWLFVEVFLYHQL